MTIVSEDLMAELRDADLQTEVYYRDSDGELVPLQVRWSYADNDEATMILERAGT